MIDLRLAVHQYIIGRKFAVSVKFPMIFRDFPTSYRCKFGEFFSKRTFSPHYKISLPCYHGTVFIFSSLKAKKANHTTFHSENMAKFHGHKSTKGQIILLLPYLSALLFAQCCENTATLVRWSGEFGTGYPRARCVEVGTVAKIPRSTHEAIGSD